MLTLILLIFFAAGGFMLFRPHLLIRIHGTEGYSEAYYNRFLRRVCIRAVGMFFMLFCLGPFLARISPPGAKRFFVAVVIVFGLMWVGAVVLALGAWIAPMKRWMDGLSTDKLTPAQGQIEVAIGLAVLVIVLACALVPVAFSSS